MTTKTLTERDVSVLRAIARNTNCQASLDAVAARMGYRPARTGRLSVLSTLRGLLNNHGKKQSGMYGESSMYVGRLAPKDQWDCEIWFLTDAGRSQANGQSGN